jgi:hypothetical protein
LKSLLTDSPRILLDVYVFESMVDGIDEYRPVRIGIFHATLFVSSHIFYVDFGVGILDWM